MCDMTHSDAMSICCRHNQLIHMCNVTQFRVWYDSFLRVTWLIQMLCQCAATSVKSTATTSAATTNLFTFVTRLISACDMTGLDAMSMWCRHKQLIHTYNVTQFHVWRDSFVCVTWLFQIPCRCVATMWCRHNQLIHTRDVTQFCVWHDSSRCTVNLLHPNECEKY